MDYLEWRLKGISIVNVKPLPVYDVFRMEDHDPSNPKLVQFEIELNDEKWLKNFKGNFPDKILKYSTNLDLVLNIKLIYLIMIGLSEVNVKNKELKDKNEEKYFDVKENEYFY